MCKEIRLADLVVDCPDAKKLSQFYHELLDWKTTELFGNPAVVSENGVMLVFVQEDDYVPPVWPEVEGRQQKQVHFDFLVSDLNTMITKAEALGARKADTQFGGSQFVTLFDPAGHPFCLVQA